MSVERAAGYADYSETGLNRLIPTLWAAQARDKLNETLFLPEITNANVVGAADVKNLGDKVIVPTIPNVPVYDYKKGEIFTADYLESPAVEMTVDKAKRFTFAVDEIDLKQVKIKDWVSKWSTQANFNIKKAIETQVFANIYADVDSQNAGTTAGVDANIDLGATGLPLTLTKTTVISKIIQAGQVLVEQNVPLDDNWWMLIPPAMASILQDSDLKNVSMTGDDSSILRKKGLLGKINQFSVYTTNLLAKDAGTSDYHILFGHRDAMWFVTQYTKVKLYEPEGSFSQAMKGLNVYGFGVIQPAAIGEMVANITV